jgi:NADH:ubiquinone oxidoreductase subunit 2 (subunit N)
MGFIGKFYLIASGVWVELSRPVLALVFGSVIGLYY